MNSHRMFSPFRSAATLIAIVSAAQLGCKGSQTTEPPVAPSIDIEPADQTVDAPTTATFSVVVSGTGPLHFQWQKDGVDIPNATSSIYTTGPSAWLDNGAKFSVVVSNLAGTVTSRSASLSVRSIPIITGQPNNQTAMSPAGAAFSVSAVGTQPLNYQWMRNGIAISGANAATYTLPSTSLADHGALFSVAVSNVLGTTQSVTASLSVIAPGPNPVIGSVSPTTGTVGTLVTLSGVAFTGARIVEFNGKVATSFSVRNDFLVTARVPVGATTGKISVTTANGTAVSNADFTVDPECSSNCPEWKLTGANLDPRYSHGAARLPDGRVLVTGGVGSDVLRSTEIFDPAAQSWSQAEACPIWARSALSLSDGRIMASDFGSSVVYDPATSHWGAASIFGTRRFEQTFTALPDGRVLMAGGDDSHGEAVASAEIYDPRNQTWSSAGSMSTARSSHTATLLPDRKSVLIAGGYNEQDGALRSAELYDIQSGTFSVVPNEMLSRHSFHNAVLLENGKVLIVNGDEDPELFDSETSTFARAARPLFASFLGQAVVLPQGTVLVTAHDLAELYEPSTDTWKPLPNLQRARPFATVTLLSDGRVLAAGGLGEDIHPIGDAEIFCSTGCN